MNHSKHFLGWGRPTFVAMVSVTALLWVTGVGLHAWPLENVLDASQAEVLLHRCVVVVHGVLTWGFCILLGRGVWPHVRVMWHKQVSRQWMLGLFTAFLFLMLVLSGLCILYGFSQLHDASLAPHYWIGLGLPVPLVPHIWKRYWARSPSETSATHLK